MTTIGLETRCVRRSDGAEATVEGWGPLHVDLRLGGSVTSVGYRAFAHEWYALPPPTRGELVNRKASAGARLVRAEEALAVAEKHARQRRAPETRAAAVAQARRDEAMLAYLEASIALDAAGGP